MHHDVNEMTLGPSPETSAEVGLMAQGRERDPLGIPQPT
jgi:hypothetical protein